MKEIEINPYKLDTFCKQVNLALQGTLQLPLELVITDDSYVIRLPDLDRPLPKKEEKDVS